ncbi:hypothetical protein [Oscillibacter sp.]|uniref:hypothetical protein n=1 Tax=Oscillibacter sp. TaxID=1945593 RepID=UPI0028A26600|nr:hypothetical protein [Oscillibacter sp.]
MDPRAKKRRNRLQNIAIALLSVSAVALFIQTQLFNLRTDGGYLSNLFTSGSVQKTQSVSGLTDLELPARVAVTGAYGRWAGLALTTGDEDFSKPGNLLMEALGSAGTMKKCGVEDFRAALRVGTDTGGSVYYDFGGALPLSILSGVVGARWSGGEISARRVLVQVDETVVRLFAWDGEGACFVCTTAISAESVRELVREYSLGSAWFAFDRPESDGHVAAFSLFSDQLDPPVNLAVSAGIADSDAVLEALSFNPHTNSRYPEPSGAEVVVEGDRNLRIYPNGELSYQGGSGTLRIASVEEVPTETETVVGVFQLLNGLLPDQSNGTLFLQELSAAEDSVTLRFGYQYAGLPIRFADGGFAAEVTLVGASIVRLTLRVRQYTPAESGESLLPLAQALSIARAWPGRELAVRYVDGGSTATAQWLAE